MKSAIFVPEKQNMTEMATSFGLPDWIVFASVVTLTMAGGLFQSCQTKGSVLGPAGEIRRSNIIANMALTTVGFTSMAMVIGEWYEVQMQQLDHIIIL
jgi:hypothetical protein